MNTLASLLRCYIPRLLLCEYYKFRISLVNFYATDWTLRLMAFDQYHRHAYIVIMVVA